jgi:hypothetical protein
MMIALTVSIVVGLMYRVSKREHSNTAGRLAIILIFPTLIVLAFSAASPVKPQSAVEAIQSSLHAITSRSYGIDSVIATQVYLSGHESLGTDSLNGAATAWVPRAVWPDKPKSFSEQFGRVVFWFSPLAGLAFFAPTLTGEGLLMAGPATAALLWALLGVAAATVDCHASLHWRLLWLFPLVHLVEGSVIAQAFLALPMLLAGLLLIPRRPTAVGAASDATLVASR